MPSNRTIESIRLQSCDTLERSTVFDCGCHLRHVDERWSLCVYHEGYDDASEKTDELQGLIDVYAEARDKEGFIDAIDALLAAATTKEDDRG